MGQRLLYHFEPRSGWMNDPNGLIFYKGNYHAFFQHYPYAPHWGQMHWGHAVSRDFIHWTELDIALRPDMPYENTGGCFSGSAIEKDGDLYLFYTSVSDTLGQTQSLAISHDGIHFCKYPGNPVINACPPDGKTDFRDPKVFSFGSEYRMVCGSGLNGTGRVLLFGSTDLLYWKYLGVLFEDSGYGPAVECPDLFPLDGKYVLMFSRMGQTGHSTQFVSGRFDGTSFFPEVSSSPEAGPQFYAPQTFSDGKRRIMIGWLYDWSLKPSPDAQYAGALSIPRELSLHDGKVFCLPVSEAAPLLTSQNEHVRVGIDSIDIVSDGKSLHRIDIPVRKVSILSDTVSIEVFINGGEYSASCRLDR